MPPKERINHFWERVDRSGGTEACWEWQGSFNNKGYGRAYWEGKKQLAHRIAYALSYGVNPGELLVLHSCDNPKCVNPHHLSLGTQAENMADMVRKGRMNHNKLTLPIAQRIKTEYAKGGITQRELAQEHGVCSTLIGYIINGKRWAS